MSDQAVRRLVDAPLGAQLLPLTAHCFFLNVLRITRDWTQSAPPLFFSGQKWANADERGQQRATAGNSGQ
jgi:hypothetical protein